MYEDSDIIKQIRKQRLRWLIYMTRLDKNTPTTKAFDVLTAGEAKNDEDLHTVGKDQLVKDLAVHDIFQWAPNSEKRETIPKYF